jgi:DedD protein
MAKAISDEELQLKKRARRRLVGATALVLLVVVFLPMFLDSEPKPLNQDIAITIPPVPNAEAPPSPTTPAPVAVVPPAPQPGPAAQPEPQPAPEPKAEVQKSEPKPEPKPEPKAEPKPAALQQAKIGDAFVVQLGAFSNPANAKALQKKLRDNKFTAYTEVVKIPGGDRTRVRVGPYASREAAERARDRLKARKLIIGEAAVVRQGD